SQAVIITTDKDGRSHAWNAVNHNGTITYIDAQTGRRSPQPLHNGDNGVFAIPLDPNRTPTTPDHHTTDPTHNPDHDRTAPEEAAGTAANSAVDEDKRKRDALVKRANEEPGFFKEHYRKNGYRRDSEEEVDGVRLPQLKPDPDNPGKWTADTVEALKSTYMYRGMEVFGDPSTLLDGNETKLDEAVEKRRKALDDAKVARENLKAADAAAKADPSPENLQALEDAENARSATIAETTDKGEELGESAAMLHAIPDNFPGAEPAGVWGKGNNRFDQVWKLPDGSYVVVEAKAPTGKIGDRASLEDSPSKGRQVEQGHPDYFDAILAQMDKRATAEPENAELAEDLRDAWAQKKVIYVAVWAQVDKEKSEDDDGNTLESHNYGGYRMKRFNIDTRDADGNPL
ncbi:toxin glutamine deamidase domain-containing protein, partial [Kitasatospora sp. NPDC004289]